MQNNELTSQLAQISTALKALKHWIKQNNIVGQIDQSQALKASSLVGRGVMVSGNKIVVFQPTDGKGETENPVMGMTPKYLTLKMKKNTSANGIV